MVGGSIMIESSPMVIPRLEAWINNSPAWRLQPTVKDLSGHPRIIVAEKI
jgi:hypothetical protein